MFNMNAKDLNKKYFAEKLNNDTAETLLYRINNLQKNYYIKTPSEIIKDFTAVEAYLEALCDANIITWEERGTLYHDINSLL